MLVPAKTCCYASPFERLFKIKLFIKAKFICTISDVTNLRIYTAILAFLQSFWYFNHLNQAIRDFQSLL